VRRRLAWVWFALCCGIACPACPAQDAPPRRTGTPAPPIGPIYFLIDRTQDLNGLIQRFDQPDYVLLRGSTYETMQRLANPATATQRPETAPRFPVTSRLQISGKVEGDLARLRLQYDIATQPEDTPWMPLQLGGIVLTEARVGDQPLPVRYEKDLGWQIKIPEGTSGSLQVEIDAVGRIRSSAAGSSLEMSIPEAAMTRVDLVAPGAVEAAQAGSDPLAIESLVPSKTTRFHGLIAPRRNLDLRWTIAAQPPPSETPALLTAQGQIELQIGRGSLRARSAWNVRCERGSVATLSFTLDPSDTLLAVEVDDRPIPGDIPRDAATRELTIPLPVPLRAGASTRVILLLRRDVPVADTLQLVYHGTPLSRAVAQSGVLVVGQESPDLWISGATRRGLRELDPRGERAAREQNRVPVALSYQFVEQPFELELRIDSSPPLARCRSRSIVRLQGGIARIETTFDLQMTRGHARNLEILLPRELELLSRGPDSLITSSAILEPSGREGLRILRLTIDDPALATADLSLVLVSSQMIPPQGLTRIVFPTPNSTVDAGSSVAVLAPPSERVELANHPDAAFTVQDPTGPALGPWSSVPPSETPRLLVSSTSALPALSLTRAPRPLVLNQQSRLLATLDPASLDVRQDIELMVESGALKSLDVLVPQNLDASFVLEGSLPLHRTRIGERSGMIQYSLQLTSAVSDRLRLRTRLQQPLALNPSNMISIEIPRVRILSDGMTRSASSTQISAQPGIEVEPDGPGWKPAASASPLSDAPATARVKLLRTDSNSDADAIRIRARAVPRVDLPGLLVSRAFLKTTSLNGVLTTLFLFRLERHPGSLDIELPSDASWIQAWVAGQSVERVDQPSSNRSCRLSLPVDRNLPLVVGILYRHPESSSWEGPRFIGSHAVLQCFWEIQLPWSDAILGKPRGWSDENQWYFDRYVWKRKPTQSDQELLNWVAEDPAQTAFVAALDPIPPSGQHGYLFARLGSPSRIALCRMSRAWLVVFASGGVLICGLAILLGAIPARTFGWITLILAILAVAFLPSSLLLAFGQSAAVGFLLLVIATATRWLVERRAARGQILNDVAANRSPSPSGLERVATPPGPAPVGSEDSTVIRSGRSRKADSRIATASNPPSNPALSSSSGVQP
jgi:hypothetical protein